MGNHNNVWGRLKGRIAFRRPAFTPAPSAFRKHFFGGEHRVQHFRETQIRHAVDKGFHDFLTAQADIERGMDMDGKLFLAAALCRQGRQRNQFAPLIVQMGPVVDFAEAETDDVPPQIGRNVRQRLHHLRTLFAVDGEENIGGAVAATGGTSGIFGNGVKTVSDGLFVLLDFIPVCVIF